MLFRRKPCTRCVALYRELEKTRLLLREAIRVGEQNADQAARWHAELNLQKEEETVTECPYPKCDCPVVFAFEGPYDTVCPKMTWRGQ